MIKYSDDFDADNEAVRLSEGEVDFIRDFLDRLRLTMFPLGNSEK